MKKGRSLPAADAYLLGCLCAHLGQYTASNGILAPHFVQYFTSVTGLGGAISGALGLGASSPVESCCAEKARGKHEVIRAIIPEIPNNRNPKNIIQIESSVGLSLLLSTQQL
jgi:hypothetical protein